MDDRLRKLMQDLGNAINESLSESERIAEAIGEIRRAGYDVFLVLEATIGFNRREDADVDQEPAAAHFEGAGGRGHDFESKARFKWTSQDQKFLKALRISLDDDSR